MGATATRSSTLEWIRVIQAGGRVGSKPLRRVSTGTAIVRPLAGHEAAHRSRLLAATPPRDPTCVPGEGCCVLGRPPASASNGCRYSSFARRAAQVLRKPTGKALHAKVAQRRPRLGASEQTCSAQPHSSPRPGNVQWVSRHPLCRAGYAPQRLATSRFMKASASAANCRSLSYMRRQILVAGTSFSRANPKASHTRNPS